MRRCLDAVCNAACALSRALLAVCGSKGCVEMRKPLLYATVGFDQPFRVLFK